MGSAVVMNEAEADKAHEVLNLFQDVIVSAGIALLKDLTPEQQKYVLAKCHDGFRFWRVEEKP
jgi:hypothetical protein